MSYPVILARLAIKTFLQSGKTIDIPPDAPEQLRREKAAVFVSLHKNSELRGCIGTLEPAADCLAKEIISNAISAAVRDPRFEPLSLTELEQVKIKVDQLSKAETATINSLDPRKFGIIVHSNRRLGVLLPDLDGVETIDQQLSIAASKAGIDLLHDEYTIKRFTVNRFSE